MLSKRKIAWINLRLKLTRLLSQNKFIAFILCTICVLTIFTQIHIQPDISNNYDSKPMHNGNNQKYTSFLLVGDWGIVEETNEDYNNKLKVAEAMSIIQANYNTSFVISVGDQYYDNGVHLQQPLKDLETSSDLNYWFINHFENVYDKSLSPWYLLLGNHDMRGSAKALFKYSNISVSGRWNLPYNYYYKDFPVSAEVHQTQLFRVIFIDTSSIMCYNDDRRNLDSLESWSCDEAWYHFNDDKKSQYNERDEDKFVPREVQIEWIKKVIMEADNDDNIRDIFIAGHHCLWSNGPHGCPQIMGKHIRPLFERSRKIKAYLCGHNHGLEHFEWTMDADFIVDTFLSGAGACLHGMDEGRCEFGGLVDSEEGRNEVIELKYLAVERGFATFHFGYNGGTDIVVRFWDSNADKIYEVII